MKTNTHILFTVIVASSMAAISGIAEVKIVADHNPAGSAAAAFRFKTVPPPSKGDAATTATFTVVDGQPDGNGGELARLHDDRLPKEADQPSENFFFRPGSDGGRVLVDLGRPRELQEINTFSWHPDARGPQVYQLYASDGRADGFNERPKRDVDPTACGWARVARVDTRPAAGAGGGQHGVSITNSTGHLGSYRYLLFDIRRTEDRDAFGNTFYSEIDVIEANTARVAATSEPVKSITTTFEAGGGKYRFTLETTVAPDLTEWAERELRPVVQEWYPKLVALLPSDGFSPRTNVTIRFRDDMRGIPASAGGGFINCNAGWFRRELKREALGSVVHEMVHVVQSYGRVRRDDADSNSGFQRMPGWLIEGIPDYLRWFLYEPQTKGAEITARNLARAKYDASYRITGNFLDWVSRNHDSNIVQKLNAAGRAGRYRPELWKEATGKTVEELGQAWKTFHEQRLAVPAPAAADPVKAVEPKP